MVTTSSSSSQEGLVIREEVDEAEEDGEQEAAVAIPVDSVPSAVATQVVLVGRQVVVVVVVADSVLWLDSFRAEQVVVAAAVEPEGLVELELVDSITIKTREVAGQAAATTITRDRVASREEEEDREQEAEEGALPTLHLVGLLLQARHRAALQMLAAVVGLPQLAKAVVVGSLPLVVVL